MDHTKLSTFYKRLEEVVNKLTEEQLNTPVGEDKWTPKQLIHHLADAQTQAFYRIVWLLTEDNTTLKPFQQDDWVKLLGDEPIDGAMAMLKGTYTRWAALVKNMSEADFAKTGNHPEIGEVTVGPLIEYYIGHGESHVEQFASMVQ